MRLRTILSTACSAIPCVLMSNPTPEYTQVPYALVGPLLTVTASSSAWKNRSRSAPAMLGLLLLHLQPLWLPLVDATPCPFNHCLKLALNALIWGPQVWPVLDCGYRAWRGRNWSVLAAAAAAAALIVFGLRLVWCALVEHPATQLPPQRNLGLRRIADALVRGPKIWVSLVVGVRVGRHRKWSAVAVVGVLLLLAIKSIFLPLVQFPSFGLPGVAADPFGRYHGGKDYNPSTVELPARHRATCPPERCEHRYSDWCLEECGMYYIECRSGFCRGDPNYLPGMCKEFCEECVCNRNPECESCEFTCGNMLGEKLRSKPDWTWFGFADDANRNMERVDGRDALGHFTEPAGQRWNEETGREWWGGVHDSWGSKLEVVDRDGNVVRDADAWMRRRTKVLKFWVGPPGETESPGAAGAVEAVEEAVEETMEG